MNIEPLIIGGGGGGTSPSTLKKYASQCKDAADRIENAVDSLSPDQSGALALAGKVKENEKKLSELEANTYYENLSDAIAKADMISGKYLRNTGLTGNPAKNPAYHRINIYDVSALAGQEILISGYIYTDNTALWATYKDETDFSALIIDNVVRCSSSYAVGKHEERIVIADGEKYLAVAFYNTKAEDSDDVYVKKIELTPLKDKIDSLEESFSAESDSNAERFKEIESKTSGTYVKEIKKEVTSISGNLRIHLIKKPKAGDRLKFVINGEADSYFFGLATIDASNAVVEQLKANASSSDKMLEYVLTKDADGVLIYFAGAGIGVDIIQFETISIIGDVEGMNIPHADNVVSAIGSIDCTISDDEYYVSTEVSIYANVAYIKLKNSILSGEEFFIRDEQISSENNGLTICSVSLSNDLSYEVIEEFYRAGGAGFKNGTLKLVATKDFDTLRIVNFNNRRTFTIIQRKRNKSKANTYANLYGKKWLAIGDSITHENNNSRIPGYPTLIANETGLLLQNRGNSGWQMFEAIPMLDKLNDDYVPDLITILLGTNNLGFATPLGSLNDEWYQKGEYAGNHSFYAQTQLLFEKLMDKYPYARIIVYGLIRRMDMVNYSETEYFKNGLGLGTDELNAALKEICKYYAIPFVDMDDTVDPRPLINRQRFFTKPDGSDGLHPNALGHRLFMAPKILDGIVRYMPIRDFGFELIRGVS